MKRKGQTRKEVEQLDALRPFLTGIYTYGFYSKQDMLDAGLVSCDRTYDNSLELIKELYSFDKAESDKQSALMVWTFWKKRHFYFRRWYFSGQTELLSAVYGLHRISARESCLTVVLLSTYSTTDNLSISMLTTLASDVMGEYVSVDENALGRCRKSLVNAGYLKEGTFDYCRDLIHLSDRDLLELYQMASFFAGSGYPRIPALFLKRALLRMLRFRGVAQPPEQFLFRDCPSGNVLDEDMMMRLLKCCKGRKKIYLNPKNEQKSSSNQNRRKRPRPKQKYGGETVSPVSLMADTKLGRWYLLGAAENRASITRVSKIQKICSLTEFDREKALAVVEECTKHSYLCLSESDDSIHVEAVLRFQDAHLREQFERELLLGEIVKRDGQEVYCVDVNDLSEIRPLFRSYFRYLELPLDSQLRRELTHEYKRMWENYGAVSQVLQQ